MSLLDGISKPKEIASRCVELGYKAAALTDHGNVSGIPVFAATLQKAGVRPLLGLEAYISPQLSTIKTQDNRSLSHLCILARNLSGWQDLLRLLGKANCKESMWYGKPRLSTEELAEFTQGRNLIAFSGHPGSDLGNIIFHDARAAYRAGTYEEVRDYHIHPDASARMLAKIAEYVSIFGRENFFLEVQIVNPDLLPASVAIAKCLRWASKKTGIPCVATADSHYVRREDAYDQRVVLARQLGTTLGKVRQKLDDGEDVALGSFFKSNDFHIPSVDELLVHHTEQEIRMSTSIADMIDDFTILGPPKIPNFPGTGGMTQEGYLRELCRSGFEERIERGRIYKPVDEYRNRLDEELALFEHVGLSGYFNIVHDVVWFSKNRGRYCGKGRGSVGGCLIPYLIGITEVDPLRFDLLVERFFNEGRYGSLPDVDLDFPKSEREAVYNHVQKTYGPDKVAKIGTFSTLAGKSAVDEVLNAHDIPFEIRKTITKIFPDKARISEELQDMADKGEEPSIIRYTLDIYRNELMEWVRQNDDGTLEGEYARHFEQAIRLEGVKKSRSKHAAGVIISDEPLSGRCPLRYDEGENAWVADMEYQQLEKMGLMKLDVLGIAQLDKMEGVRDQARTGRLLY